MDGFVRIRHTIQTLECRQILATSLLRDFAAADEQLRPRLKLPF
jgi:hypothetical protein